MHFWLYECKLKLALCPNVKTYINAHLKIIEWHLFGEKMLFCILSVVVHFKWDYKKWYQPGSRNDSILSTWYLVQGVRCLQSWRLHKEVLDWASRNGSQNDTADLSVLPGDLLLGHNKEGEQSAGRCWFWESYYSHAVPGIRKWPILPPDTCEAGDGTWDGSCRKVQEDALRHNAASEI